MPVFIILFIILIILLSTNIVIVPQAKAYVIERLGTYQNTWSAGLHVKLPFFDRVARKVTLKEQVADFQPQPVITKDNVTIMIDSVVFFSITDPKLFTYGIETPLAAIENLSATTLRNIIGSLTLDETLTGRDTINSKIRAILDEATDPWGIKVNRVEVKNITPPAAIREAMEKQMKAERERREAILTAEGRKQSSILVAEGEKEGGPFLPLKQRKSQPSRRQKVRQKQPLQFKKHLRKPSDCSTSQPPHPKLSSSKLSRHLRLLQTGRLQRLSSPVRSKGSQGWLRRLKKS